jgi:hypothetical protein
MPAWEPTAREAAIEPAQTAVPVSEPARQAGKRACRGAANESRRVADPFDAADEGANCMRCGYLVEPARERRGLMTCAGCA